MTRPNDLNEAEGQAHAYDTHPSDSGAQSPKDIVNWEGPEDPGNPFNWPVRKKWRVTLTACFVTFIVGVNGTSITSAAEAINERFHVSDLKFPNSYWPVTSWSVGAALVPLAGLPLMETFGVRSGYLIAYAGFTLFIIPQALASNFATLIVTRLFCGGCAGILQNVTDGIISDLWDGPCARSLPMSLYVWSLLAGLTIGPVIGGVIIHYLYWRWIFYIQLIFYGVLFPVLILILPEMRGEILLKRKARKARTKTGKEIYAEPEINEPGFIDIIREVVKRPSRMLCTEPVVFFFTVWSSFCFGTVLMFTQSVAQTYKTNHSWSPFLTGSVQSAVVVGETLGCLAEVYQNRLYAHSARRNQETPGEPIPEARLYLSILGSFLGLTGGYFWYAWTSYPFLHWILPTIGLAFVGFGSYTVVSAVSKYVTDSYKAYASSAIAAVAFGENVFAAFLPLATQSMYTDLGFQWASSLLGFLALALSFVPVVLILYGKQIRKKSPFIKEAQ